MNENDTLTLAERRDTWLADRRTMITGTDAAQILAMDADPATAAELQRFGGPMGVYLAKIGEDLPFEMTGAIEAGRRLERPILGWYAERDPNEIIPILYEPPYTVRRSPTFAHIGASLDATRQDFGAPVDAKNVRAFDPTKWGDDGTDEMPIYYAVQLVMQMHVTGADFADLAVLFSGQDLRVYRLHRDLPLEADILAKCFAFWQHHVEPRVPPPVDGSAAWTAHLKRSVRQASDLILEGTATDADAARRYKDVGEQIKDLEHQKEAIGNGIRAAIGEAKGIAGPGFRANWSQVKEQVGTDWEAVARDLARVVAETVAETDTPVAPADVLAVHTPQHQVVIKQAYRRLTVTVKE